jgi:hypothetical protein
LPVMISKGVGLWEMINEYDFVFPADLTISSVTSILKEFRIHYFNSDIDRDFIRNIAIKKFSPDIIADDFASKLQSVIDNAS